MNYRRRADAQSGIALVVAMLVLGVAMATVVGLSSSFMMAVRRAENQWLADQAWYYLTGAETMAVEILRLRLEEQNSEPEDALLSVDVVGQFETDDGWLAFNVADLQGRFNLNSLLPPRTEESAPQPQQPVRSLAQRRFIRLLQSFPELELTEPEVTALLEALQDWLDGDVLETGFGGAEQNYYGQRSIPYRPADGPMRDVSELLLVKGVSPEIYQALQQYVTVWPQQGGTINVASADVAVLQSLYAGQEGDDVMGEDQAEALRQAIVDKEVATLSDFLSRPEWGAQPLSGEGLVTRSEVFVVYSQTQVGRLHQTMESVVQIRENKAQVLARSLKMM